MIVAMIYLIVTICLIGEFKTGFVAMQVKSRIFVMLEPSESIESMLIR